jgi:hypothetical protein
LTFDAASESFPDEPEANKLLTREYSDRFEMPSQVWVYSGIFMRLLGGELQTCPFNPNQNKARPLPSPP